MPDPGSIVGPPGLEGMVVRRISNVFWVRPGDLGPAGPAAAAPPAEYACSLPARLRKEQVDVRIGDKVRISDLDDANAKAVIAERLPRANSLSRPPIANIDQVVVVVAASQPEFNPHLLDRFLILAAMSGLPAAIALNKRDLVSGPALAEFCEPYLALGCQVVPTSARMGDLGQLAELLRGKVSVFAGPSGVGKSSLLNAFDRRLSLKEGEVSARLGSGRHTTTFASLYSVAGGLVADTPGYSHLEFPDWPPEDLGWLFPEMAPAIPQCPLSRCLHETEPGCAVREQARISALRYDSYLEFLAELKDIRSRTQASSSKVEEATKTTGGGVFAKRLVRIGAEQREDSRRMTRQHLAELASQATDGKLDEEALEEFDG